MRFIVCGTVPAIERWRRSRALQHRDVVRCSTTQGHLALRGLGGDVTVVYLPDWASASERVRTEVDRTLRVIAATGGRVSTVGEDDVPRLGPCRFCGHEGSDAVAHLVSLAAGGDAHDPGNRGPVHSAPCPTCRRVCAA